MTDLFFTIFYRQNAHTINSVRLSIKIMRPYNPHKILLSTPLSLILFKIKAPITTIKVSKIIVEYLQYLYYVFFFNFIQLYFVYLTTFRFNTLLNFQSSIIFTALILEYLTKLLKED